MQQPMQDPATLDQNSMTNKVLNNQANMAM
jgi:hypothetical protein